MSIQFDPEQSSPIFNQALGIDESHAQMLLHSLKRNRCSSSALSTSSCSPIVKSCLKKTRRFEDLASMGGRSPSPLPFANSVIIPTQRDVPFLQVQSSFQELTLRMEQGKFVDPMLYSEICEAYLKHPDRPHRRTTNDGSSPETANASQSSTTSSAQTNNTDPKRPQVPKLLDKFSKLLLSQNEPATSSKTVQASPPQGEQTEVIVPPVEANRPVGTSLKRTQQKSNLSQFSCDDDDDDIDTVMLWRCPPKSK
eukprot:c8719_g1_i2.p1 GENE.c8719_g1_i2~~c8719_g1_i2.p1  ORF type:complete len:253 (+),score=46.90 c8719_g1_i2:306-1064(+)